MFTDNELKTTKGYIQRKKDDILQAEDKISDLEYVQSLQTLAKLGEAVNQKIQGVNSYMDFQKEKK